MADDLTSILSIDLSRPGTMLASVITDRDAIGQFFVAEEYLAAAHIMTEACGNEVRLLRPKYMLLCQALELCLKSFLLHCNVTPKTINSQALRHDLALLLDRCLEHVGAGQPFIGPDHQAIIRAVAPAASMYYFRYGHREPATILKVASVHVPLMRDALDASCALFDVVRHRVLPSKPSE